TLEHPGVKGNDSKGNWLLAVRICSGLAGSEPPAERHGEPTSPGTNRGERARRGANLMSPWSLATGQPTFAAPPQHRAERGDQRRDQDDHEDQDANRPENPLNGIPEAERGDEGGEY